MGRARTAGRATRRDLRVPAGDSQNRALHFFPLLCKVLTDVPNEAHELRRPIAVLRRAAVSLHEAAQLARRRPERGRQLLRAAQDLEKGKLPPGLSPASQAVRSASFELDRKIPFDEAPGEPLKVKQGVAHTSI